MVEAARKDRRTRKDRKKHRKKDRKTRKKKRANIIEEDTIGNSMKTENTVNITKTTSHNTMRKRRMWMKMGLLL